MCTHADHEALKTNDARWAALQPPRNGGQMELTPGEILELRNCDRCHSTLVREVKP